MDLEILQQKTGYYFNDQRLLQTALVHRSYLNEKDRNPEINEHNERLEFLGDAVLELVVTEYLYATHPEDEGYLTSLRAALVNYKTIGQIGNELGLDEIILLSKGEKEELGRARLTIVADCVEAVLGAMYLDGGYIPCQNFIKEKIIIKLPEIISDQRFKDSKTQLQELSQKQNRITPRYQVLTSEGKDHEKVFRVGVFLAGEMIATGEGRSKQDAETEAASKALQVLQGV